MMIRPIYGSMEYLRDDCERFAEEGRHELVILNEQFS